MAILGGLIFLIGAILGLVGWIWLIVMAFKNEDTIWGILSIFIQICALIYGFMNYQQAKKPVLISLAAIGCYIVGAVLVGIGAAGDIANSMPPPQ